MLITPCMLGIVLPLVFVAGFIDAVAGGGGLLTLPTYLLVGLPPPLAAGTNKGSAMFGTTAALLRYQRSAKIDWSAALPATLFALPGSFLGAQLQMLVPTVVLRIIIAVSLPIVAIFILRSRSLTPTKPKVFAKKKRMLLCAGIGLLLGLYDGFLGPGTGTFLILCFTFFCGMDAVVASGSAKVVNLASNIAALIAFALQGQVLYLRLFAPSLAVS